MGRMELNLSRMMELRCAADHAKLMPQVAGLTHAHTHARAQKHTHTHTHTHITHTHAHTHVPQTKGTFLYAGQGDDSELPCLEDSKGLIIKCSEFVSSAAINTALTGLCGHASRRARAQEYARIHKSLPTLLPTLLPTHQPIHLRTLRCK